MRVIRGSISTWEPLEGPSAVTIGVFDGVHLGHRMVLDQLRSSEQTSVVLTFDPHPAEVLSPGSHPRLITTIDERISLFESAGVDVVGVLDLAEIRPYDPERFVVEVLVETLGARLVAVGGDFHFGRDRAGDVTFLRGAGSRHGFELVVVDLLELDGVVTSSRIRQLIESGDVATASALLGSRYRLSNEVIGGERRGRDLGFPTANLEPPDRKVIPAHGIYAAFALVGGEVHQAAVSVGVRPTFDGRELLIEAFLLDFHGEIYGERVTIEFVERLRPELAFETVEALVERMKADVSDVRRILGAVMAG